MDRKLKKWLSWREIIYRDILELLEKRDTFWGVQEIIKSNVYKEIETRGHVYEYIGHTYVAYMAIGIRRQIKVDKDSISLLRLLNEISENPKILSREYYVELYKSSPKEFAHRDFDRFCGDYRDHISPDMVKSDIKALKEIVFKVETFADRRIAHHDTRCPELPRFSDLDESLDKIGEMYQKYHLALTAECIASLTPVVQYDWKEIFTVPWIKNEEIHSPEVSLLGVA